MPFGQCKPEELNDLLSDVGDRAPRFFKPEAWEPLAGGEVKSRSDATQPPVCSSRIVARIADVVGTKDFPERLTQRFAGDA